MSGCYVPSEPLLELARGRGYTDGQLAELVGASIRTVQRWKNNSKIRVDLADRAALALGLHPVLLWGSLW